METLGIFLIGMVGGLLFEYVLHRFYHTNNIGSHKEHHNDFFFLEPLATAKRAHPLLEYMKYAALLFLAIDSLAMFIGTKNFLILYAGMFFHLMVIYQAIHFLFHYDQHLPEFITKNSWFIWWKRCHIEHHWHSARKNYCVSCPWVDMLFRTYKRPRDTYRSVPVPQKAAAAKAAAAAEADLPKDTAPDNVANDSLCSGSTGASE